MNIPHGTVLYSGTIKSNVMQIRIPARVLKAGLTRDVAQGVPLRLTLWVTSASKRKQNRARSAAPHPVGACSTAFALSSAALKPAIRMAAIQTHDTHAY